MYFITGVLSIMYLITGVFSIMYLIIGVQDSVSVRVVDSQLTGSGFEP